MLSDANDRIDRRRPAWVFLIRSDAFRVFQQFRLFVDFNKHHTRFIQTLCMYWTGSDARVVYTHMKRQKTGGALSFSRCLSHPNTSVQWGEEMSQKIGVASARLHARSRPKSLYGTHNNIHMLLWLDRVIAVCRRICRALSHRCLLLLRVDCSNVRDGTFALRVCVCVFSLSRLRTASTCVCEHT